MKEIWEPLKSPLDGYSISTLGNIRGKTGKILKPLKPNIKKNMYVKVPLYDNKEQIVKIISELMVETFMGGLKPNQKVRYKDGNYLNLRLNNIELYNPEEESYYKDYPTKKEIQILISQKLNLNAIANKYKLSLLTVAELLISYKLTDSTQTLSKLKLIPPNTNSTKETWIRLSGFRVEVSNMGNVRHYLTKEIIYAYHQKSDRPVVPVVNNNGVLIETRLDKLVAGVFVDNPESLNSITHKDGDKLNCIASNLKWTNSSQRINSLSRDFNLGVAPQLKEAFRMIISGVGFLEALRITGVPRSSLLAYGFPDTKEGFMDKYLTHKEQGTEEQFLNGDFNITKIELLPGEIFKPINDFMGYYISNKGRVMSWRNFTKQRIIKLIPKGNTLVFNLCYDKRSRSANVAKLVAEAFLPKCDRQRKLYFIDGNPLNCNADNLAYITDKDCRFLAKQDKDFDKEGFIRQRYKGVLK